MATIMTKQGQLDNVVTYEHICDTVADMNKIDPKYTTLGSTCVVVNGDSGLEVYIATSNKKWRLITMAVGDSSSTNYLSKITPINNTALAVGTVIEVIGIPPYIEAEEISQQYSNYGLTEPGWYAFSRIEGTTSSATQITGAAGYIIYPDYIDIAIQFDVAALTKTIVIDWDGNTIDKYIFRATDLSIRNLDYRTTFYVYDIAEFTTWEYALTTDTTFVADKQYYIKNGDDYILAEVTAEEEIPADTYYNHSKVTFSGMARNVTYKCDAIIDCPQVYVLPEIEEDTHGCWYEIRLRHSGSFSSTLQVPEGVKVATEHTQAETVGLNMIDLHYSNVGGVKIWRFLNTHSTIPA